MSDEQWSEWIEHDGRATPPIESGVEHEVRFRDGRPNIIYNEASGWIWWHDGSGSDITHYRHKISVGEAMHKAAIDCVFGADGSGPYDTYTTDELVHAVRNMRAEIRRRSQANLLDWCKFALEQSKDFDYSGPYCGKL